MGAMDTTVATILIAGFAGLIATVQARTARAKLAFDLFEKRFEVFMDARKIVSELGALGRLSDRSLRMVVSLRAFQKSHHQMSEFGRG